MSEICQGCGHNISLHESRGCTFSDGDYACGCMDWECEELEEQNEQVRP